MKEVSGKSVALLLGAAERCGIDAARLVEGTPRDLGALRAARRLGWDTYAALLDRAADLCGGPAGLEALGSQVHGAEPLRRARSLASVLLGTRHAYWVGARWVGPGLFAHLAFDYADLGNGRIRLTVEIPRSHRPSPPFFHVVRGVLASTPRALGHREDARVELESDGRRGVYRVRPPGRLPLGAAVRRLLRLPLDAARAIEELGARQEDLNRGYAALSRAEREVRERARRAEVLDHLGRELLVQLGSERLGDDLLRALAERFGWSGAALWVGDAEVEEPRLLASWGRGRGRARSHALSAGGRRVGRLEVWGPDGSDADPALAGIFEQLLPWIAVAVAGTRAGPGREGETGRFRWHGEPGKDLFVILDAEGSIRYASPGIETLLGFSPEDALEMDVESLVHPEDWPALDQTFSSFLDGPGSATFSRARIRTRDGAWRTVEGVGMKVLDEHRRDVFMITCADVTERRRAH